MASIGGLSGGSSSSSIYGTRNVLSGLASGMDTEAMIENAVSGYQLKLSQLQQKKTKVEWKQEAYRSMITKLVGFSQKYTSYTSGTNLLSRSFFDSASKVTTHGSNASKISATGRTSSDVKINSVSKLASSATYVASKDKLKGSDTASTATASSAVDMEATSTVGALSGKMTIAYGEKQKVSISFNEKDIFTSAQQMADAINEKLKEQKITFDNGTEVDASTRIEAVVEGDKVTIRKVNDDGNGELKVSGLGGTLGEKLTFDEVDGERGLSFAADFTDGGVWETKSNTDILSEKGFTITYEGRSVTVKGPTDTEVRAAEGASYEEKYINALNAKIDENAYLKGKIKASDANGNEDGLQLQFAATETGAAFKVTTTVDKELGMEGGLSNKVNLSRTLGDILKDESLWGIGEEKKDSDGNEITEYEFKINDDSSIKVTKDMTLQQLMDKLNSDENSDVKMNYSTFSDTITFTSKESGANQEIKFSGLSAELFGSADVHGEDATFSMTVNGVTDTYTRSSNTLDVDGLNITLKDTFASGDAVTFSTSSDADKIVDAVKEMVKDYNAMMSEIKEAYSTTPLKNSKGQDYMPLTDEDAADMSESAVANYEKKAKTGLLFADRDLSNLYSNMTDALKAFGVTGADGTGIGITTSYSNGTTTLVVDENALRSALENNPDKVRDVFTGKNGNDGVMQKMKNQLDIYAGTIGASKGILVNKAGSTLAPTSIYQNTLQKEIDGFEDEIESWQEKIADKIDYYNKKFTSLEKLIAQMNNQSSMLMGLSGGY